MDDLEKKIALIENFYDYVDNVDDINPENNIDLTISSLTQIIKEYYISRIDMESDYFDPFAYVNEMNEDMVNEMDCKKLFNHFLTYILKVMDGHITDSVTINSLYNFIKYYYDERIDQVSRYYDNNAFMTDANNIIEELGVSDFSDYETSDDDNELPSYEESQNNDSRSIKSASSSENGDTTDEESSSEEENNTDNNVNTDPYLNKFLNESENSDILLYKKNTNIEKHLEKFLRVNEYY